MGRELAKYDKDIRRGHVSMGVLADKTARLNQLYYLGSLLVLVSPVVFVIMLFFGPWSLVLVSAISFGIGCVLMAFGNKVESATIPCLSCQQPIGADMQWHCGECGHRHNMGHGTAGFFFGILFSGRERVESFLLDCRECGFEQVAIRCPSCSEDIVIEASRYGSEADAAWIEPEKKRASSPTRLYDLDQDLR